MAVVEDPDVGKARRRADLPQESGGVPVDRDAHILRRPDDAARIDGANKVAKLPERRIGDKSPYGSVTGVEVVVGGIRKRRPPFHIDHLEPNVIVRPKRDKRNADGRTFHEAEAKHQTLGLDEVDGGRGSG